MSNAFKTTFGLAALTALFISTGGAVGGQSGILLALVLALLMNLGAYWFCGDLALRMAGARQIGPEQKPELHGLVEELATYARLPKPKVAIVESPSPNAFATGRDAQHAVVAVTTGVLDLLSRDELAGVLAHEFGHIRDRDILISSAAATVAGAITMLAHTAHWSTVLGGFRGANDDEDNWLGGAVGSLLMLILAPIAATLIQLAITRSREYGADDTGARIHGNPESLARALEKLDVATNQRPLPINPAAAHLFIVNPLKGVTLGGLFSTHPPIDERVRRLRRMQLGLMQSPSFLHQRFMCK
jgi:heat shock protein HtpX